MNKPLLTLSLSVICWGGVNAQIVYNDSVLMNKELHVREKLTVDQFVVLKNDLKVKENFRVNGNTVLDGKLKLVNLDTIFTMNNRSLLFVNGNGVVERGDLRSLIIGVYSDGNEDDACAYTISHGNLPTWTNKPKILYVKCPDDVKVGIGTDAPKSKLEVVGTTTTKKLAINVNPNNMLGLFHLKSQNNSSDDIVFLIERPNQRLLQLNNQGLLYAREVKVDLETWPDYVFKTDYTLKSLQEVELFIKENGHLPNVPSASTVAEEGLNLGEMNKILLEKVEELTLHLIQQEKRIVELESHISSEAK